MGDLPRDHCLSDKEGARDKVEGGSLGIHRAVDDTWTVATVGTTCVNRCFRTIWVEACAASSASYGYCVKHDGVLTPAT